MVGYGLKKYVLEYDMTIEKGTAHGAFQGFHVSFSEGASYKRCTAAVKFANASEREALISVLKTRNLNEQYRVEQIVITRCCITIRFFDNPGTMKKIRAFCDWFFPMLKQYSVTGIDECCWCGKPLDDTAVLAMENGLALPMHELCRAEAEEQFDWEEAEQVLLWDEEDETQEDGERVDFINYTHDSVLLNGKELRVCDPEGFVTFTNMNDPALKRKNRWSSFATIFPLLFLFVPNVFVQSFAGMAFGLLIFLRSTRMVDCIVQKNFNDINQAGKDSLMVGKSSLKKMQKEEKTCGIIFLILGALYFLAGICEVFV